MKRHFRKLILILPVALVVFGLSGCGKTHEDKQGGKIEADKKKVKSVNERVSKTESQSNENGKNKEVENYKVSAWKKYYSKEKDLQVFFPEGWQVVELEDEKAGLLLNPPRKEFGEFALPGRIYFNHFPRKDNMKAEDWLKMASDTSVFWLDRFEHKKEKINGFNALIFPRVQEETAELTTRKVVFVEYGNEFLSFDYSFEGGDVHYEDVFDEFVERNIN